MGDSALDGIRDIPGEIGTLTIPWSGKSYGALKVPTEGYGNGLARDANQEHFIFEFVLNTKAVVPTSSVVRPRSFGVLACAYLGQPAS